MPGQEFSATLLADLRQVLLPRHSDFCFCFLFVLGFLDHLARHVGDDAIDSSCKFKGRLVQTRNGRSRIATAVQASSDAHAERNSHGDVGLADWLFIDEELGTAWRALAISDVGLACRLELETERDCPFRNLF